jgi:hypothetical protein
MPKSKNSRKRQLTTTVSTQAQAVDLTTESTILLDEIRRLKEELARHIQQHQSRLIQEEKSMF